MSGLFGAKAPTPQPVPVNPASPVDDGGAQVKRQEAERAAIADSKARGRASTIVAGGEMAAEEQMGRGLLKSKARRAASSEMFG